MHTRKFSATYPQFLLQNGKEIYFYVRSSINFYF